MQPEYPTMPNPKLQPRGTASAEQTRQNVRSIPEPPRSPQPAPPRQRVYHKKSNRFPRWLLLLPIALVMGAGVLTVSTLMALRMAYADTILPQVYVGEVALGGLGEAEAAQELQQNWNMLLLQDGERSWQVNASALGLSLDATQTAAAAFEQGHGEGGLTALFSRVDVAPVVLVDTQAMTSELERMSGEINIAPVNAGVEMVNGTVQATAPQNGHVLDVAATITQARGEVLADGTLELVMRDVLPTVTDSSPLVQEAQALLNNPLDIQVFDPVTGDSIYWSATPSEWGTWLTAISDPNSPIGLALDADSAQVQQFLEAQAATHFDPSRSLDFESATQTVRNALNAGQPQNAYVVVTHQNRTHTVQLGETLTSIAWDYGIPYLYIQQANNGLANPAVGQEIIIPAADRFLLKPVVPNKRIVVSISQQRTTVYENGEVKWDWISSTGINNSPTWTGVYQVISHVPNAYAGNWNLHMPNFIGVYHPVPGAEFTNGFHGFPTRGGGQLLWENSLGTRVTYGCILLSDENVKLLYDWAEEGVVVEILP